MEKPNKPWEYGKYTGRSIELNGGKIKDYLQTVTVLQIFCYFVLIGTPIIAVESGVVEALGWNQYGGWRIGIRSFDGTRYYYYAHLRQNYPYAENLEEGSVVTAGDVIGYMGHTGYSATENVNNIEVVHLHWGLQLIFDDSQKEGNGEIWVDLYDLTRFLAKHRQQAEKVEGTKEWVRSTDIKDPAVESVSADQEN